VSSSDQRTSSKALATVRIAKHMNVMRSSFHLLSKIAKKASARQAKKAREATARRVAA
jgi:hypothetical protein